MTADIVQAFGVAVRASRESLGWSQERLAEQSDLNRSYVGEIERGAAVPSLVTVAKLARSLEVAPSTLVLRSEQVASGQWVRGIKLAAIAC